MKVSILIAHYNNNHFLKETLESCYLQSYTNWEIVIVDDGSIIRPNLDIIPVEFKEKVVLFYNEKNLGVGATFKKCAELCSGDLMCMLGAEDTLTSDALEICVGIHKKYENVSMTNSQMYRCDEFLNVIELFPYEPIKPHEHYIKKMSVGSLACFKRKYYLETEGFSTNFRKAVDHDIYLKLDEVGSIFFINKPLYLYRKNANGVSQGSNANLALIFSMKARLNAYQRRKKNSNLFNITNLEYKTMKASFLRQNMQYYLSKDKLPLSFLFFIRLIVFNPFLILDKQSYVDFLIYVKSKV
jgi:glycosyltransferase involved in cell wall biosynthesis